MNEKVMIDYLTHLKKSVNISVWRKRGKGLFFSKLPNGIKRLQDILENLPQSSATNTNQKTQNIQKIFKAVFNILKEKQADYKGWGERQQKTKDFYIKKFKKLKGTNPAHLFNAGMSDAASAKKYFPQKNYLVY